MIGELYTMWMVLICMCRFGFQATLLRFHCYGAKIATIAVMALLLLAHGAFGGTVPAKHAISVMKSLEAKIPVLQWKAQWNGAKLKDGYDLNSITEKEPQTEVKVVFDPVSRYFQCKVKGTYKWTDGLAPTISEVEEYSFDGKQYRKWTRSKPGMQLPMAGKEPVIGFISKDRIDKDRQQDYIQTFCMMTGLAYMPPYFWDTDDIKPLSSHMQAWIKEGRDVSIVENAKDKWTITVPGFFFGEMSVSYDLGKGGVVTEAKWVDTDRNRELIHIFIELQKVDAKLWLPKSITRVYRVDKSMSRVDITDVKIVPEVGPKTFRIDFPKGCKVIDKIENMTYIVGSAGDRQSAMRLFAQEEGITGNVGASSFSVMRISVAVASICLLLVVIVLYRARRKAAI